VLAAGLLIGAYALAAIPFGWLVGRLRGIDVRRLGSGNIGATNVLRASGRGPAAATLLLDALKGAAPVLVADALAGPEAWLPVAAGAVAVIGHCYPVYLRFRGGKGVATAAGAFLALSPWRRLIALGVFVAALAATSTVSVGSCAAALALPAAAWARGEGRIALGALPVAMLILWRHRDNLRRVMAGTEPRLGRARGSQEDP
jgi:glycerol-3-phosphate acyltransferase PlsY